MKIHVDKANCPPGITDDSPLRLCCWGEVMDGPTRCTCWEPIYDLKQAEPADIDAEPKQNIKCCHDCAYRVGSPEKTRGQQEWLEEIAADGASRFFCHQGMRRVVAWEHPDGTRIEEKPGAYDPIQHGAVAFKADGSPADLCAGWGALYRRAS